VEKEKDKGINKMTDLRFPWEEEMSQKTAEKLVPSERKDWDRFFMDIAKTIGKQSPCLIKHVGAILVRDRRILAEGYNGPPAGIPHCKTCVRIDEDVKDYSKCPAIHAEINCILLCAKHGLSTQNATLYCEFFPCAYCTGALINAGIKEIVYEKPAVDNLAMPLALASGIKVRRLEG